MRLCDEADCLFIDVQIEYANFNRTTLVKRSYSNRIKVRLCFQTLGSRAAVGVERGTVSVSRPYSCMRAKGRRRP